MMKWLQNKNVQPAAKQTETAAPQIRPDQVLNSASPLDQEIVRDLQELMGRDYQSLIRIYLEDSPKLIGQLLSALQEKDSMALIAPSHTLKSSSANLGAVNLSKIAMAIERSARTGDISTPAVEIPNLLEEFKKVEKALIEIIG
jgi:HPt (histidine-containing phosphotransfer) domain-containing protein